MTTDTQRTSIVIEAALVDGDLHALEACFPGDPAFPNVYDPLTWTHLLALAIYRAPLPLV